MPKEQYMCQLCANHGIFNQPKKGHKQKCAHKNCPCEMCSLNSKRRTLDQIERQLRNVTPQSPTTENNNANENVSTLSKETSSYRTKAVNRESHVMIATRSRQTVNPRIAREQKRPQTSIFTSIKFLVDNHRS
ncbi:DM domain-containing protein [Aphelenchoides besseyi]|nr:DM domain-containing protein [Aphelenchoides besseyi]KAI6202572.1 DM domain-containing protein [Aphelenchoides besseyi]